MAISFLSGLSVQGSATIRKSALGGSTPMADGTLVLGAGTTDYFSFRLDSGADLYLDKVYGGVAATVFSVDRSTTPANVDFTGPITCSNLRVNRATNPNLQLYRSDATTQLWELSVDSSGRLLFQESATEGGTQYTRMSIDDPGNITFSAYGSGSFTGTSAYYIIADSSGGLVEKTPAEVRADIGAGTESGTMSSFEAAGDSGSAQAITNGNTLSILGGTKISTVASATDTITIGHDTTSRTDTSSSASPGSAGTFTAVDSVTTDTTGHITALNLKTVTMPTSDNYDYWTASDGTTTQNISSQGTLTFEGGTGITTTKGSGKITFANSGVTSIVAGTNVTISGGTGAVTINADTQGDITGVIASTNSSYLGINVANTTGPIPEVGINLTGLTELSATPEGEDILLIYDEGVPQNKKITVANLLGSVNNSTISLTAGAGLTGSSSFTLNQASNQTITFSIDIGSLTTSTTASDADWFAIGTTMGSDYKIAPGNINLSTFNNDSGWTSNAGTITGSASNTQVAFFDGSATAIGGDAGLSYNKTTNTLIFNGDYGMKENGAGTFELNADGSDIITKINGFGSDGSMSFDEGVIYTSCGFYVPSGSGISVGTTSTTSNTIRCTGNIIAYYSDERLKDFEGTIPNALDKVCQLNGYYYKQNKKATELGFDNEERQVGVSAQEVEKIMPEVIEKAPISDNIEEDYLTVDYGKLVPLLIESIKELKKEIEILKNK